MTADLTVQTRLSANGVAKRYGVGLDKVLGWIRRGELEAVNISTSLAQQKPRWSISMEAIEKFERRRKSTVNLIPKQRRNGTVYGSTQRYV